MGEIEISLNPNPTSKKATAPPRMECQIGLRRARRMCCGIDSRALQMQCLYLLQPWFISRSIRPEPQLVRSVAVFQGIMAFSSRCILLMKIYGHMSGGALNTRLF